MIIWRPQPTTTHQTRNRRYRILTWTNEHVNARHPRFCHLHCEEVASKLLLMLHVVVAHHNRASRRYALLNLSHTISRWDKLRLMTDDKIHLITTPYYWELAVRTCKWLFKTVILRHLPLIQYMQSSVTRSWGENYLQCYGTSSSSWGIQITVFNSGLYNKVSAKMSHP